MNNIEHQVIYFLKTVQLPSEWQTQMVTRISHLIEAKNADRRIAEIKQVINRMDFRWDYGFITDKDVYIEQRIQLQHELEKLAPADEDELEIATDILNNFSAHWDKTRGNRKQQEMLLKLLVKRIWVRGDRVSGILLRPDFYIGLEGEITSSQS